MDIFSLLGSKASMAIIGVVMVGLTWGGLKLEIWSLEGDLAAAQVDVADYRNRNKTCQIDISTLRVSFLKQNERVNQMQAESIAISEAAERAALQELASLADLKQIAQSPPGHAEMNRFMVDLIKEGS
jgi:hypothetical protein